MSKYSKYRDFLSRKSGPKLKEIILERAANDAEIDLEGPLCQPCKDFENPNQKSRRNASERVENLHLPK